MSNADRGAEPDDDNFGLPEPELVPLENPDTKSSPVGVGQAETNFSSDQDNPSDKNDDFVFDNDPEQETSELSYINTGTEERTGQNAYTRNAFDEDSGKKLKVILAIIVPVILLTAGYLVYEYWYAAPARQNSEIEKALELESKARKEKEASISKKEVPVIEVPEIPKVGTIETITAPTGKFYVVIHSSIDGDLIMDKAKALSTEGISTAIIPPFGRWKFHRLSITNDQTFPLAQQKADELKEKYGKDLWVMRY
ncbi:MAG: hypothetical protein ACO3FI_12170 [Cyclobacteriaceae bacterium]